MEERELQQGVIEAFSQGKAYDYIANNYYRMSKETLKDIILECVYNTNKMLDVDYKEYCENVTEDLKERFDLYLPFC